MGAARNWELIFVLQGPLRRSTGRLSLRVVKVGEWVVGDEAVQLVPRQGRSEDHHRLVHRAMPHGRPVEPGILRQATDLAERPGGTFQRGLLARLAHQGFSNRTAVPDATRNNIDFPPPEISL